MAGKFMVRMTAAERASVEVLVCTTWTEVGGTTTARAEFQHRISAWKEEQVRRRFVLYDSFERYTQCESYERIVALGIRAVPLFVEEAEKSLETKDLNQIRLQRALERITKRKFRPPGAHPAGSYLCPEVVVAWWKARPQAPVEFEKHYARWKQARANGILSLETTEKVYDDSRKIFITKVTKTELGKAYDAMREFGIEAIPFVIEKLKAKDYDLLPLISELTLDEGHTQSGTMEQRVEFTLDWWESEKDKWLLPPVSAARLRDAKP